MLWIVDFAIGVVIGIFLATLFLNSRRNSIEYDLCKRIGDAELELIDKVDRVANLSAEFDTIRDSNRKLRESSLELLDELDAWKSWHDSSPAGPRPEPQSVVVYTTSGSMT